MKHWHRCSVIEAEPFASSGQLKAILQVLKLLINGDAAIVSLVQRVALTDGSLELSFSSQMTIGLSRLLGDFI